MKLAASPGLVPPPVSSETMSISNPPALRPPSSRLPVTSARSHPGLDPAVPSASSISNRKLPPSCQVWVPEPSVPTLAPGDMPPASVTAPLMLPVPPRVPFGLTTTVPVPVPESAMLLTNSVPASIVVPPV